MYIYTLRNDIKQLIQTKSPDSLIDIKTGVYSVDDNIKLLISGLWDISEYEGQLALEVYNG